MTVLLNHWMRHAFCLYAMSWWRIKCVFANTLYLRWCVGHRLLMSDIVRYDHRYCCSTVVEIRSLLGCGNYSSMVVTTRTTNTSFLNWRSSESALSRKNFPCSRVRVSSILPQPALHITASFSVRVKMINSVRSPGWNSLRFLVMNDWALGKVPELASKVIDAHLHNFLLSSCSHHSR